MSLHVTLNKSILFTSELKSKLNSFAVPWGEVFYISDTAVAVDQLCRYQSPDELFSDATANRDGAYLFIAVSLNSCTIALSLYKVYDVFFLGIDGKTVISSVYSKLTRLLSAPAINWQYCVDYLVGHDRHLDMTPTDQISRVPPGYISQWSGSAVKPSFYEINLPQPPSSHFDYISESLRRLSENRSVRLLFSGGLDSTYLLAALHNAQVQTHLEHVLPHEYEDSEAEIAKSVASEIGVSLEFKQSSRQHAFETAALFTTPHNVCANSPYEVDFFETDTKPYDAEVTSEPTLSLTGHGGDEAFLQNPPLYVAYDSVIRLRFASAFRSALDVSRLKGASLLTVLRSTVENAVCDRRKHPYVQSSEERPGSSSHFLLREYSKKTARYYHLNMILNSLEGLGVQGRVDGMYRYPLLFQGGISFVRQFPPHRMFNAQYDRIICRRELDSRSSARIAWRRSKRSSSGLVFHNINKHQSKLHTSLCSGRLVSAGLVNISKLEKAIKENCNLRLTDDLPFIVRLYQLESFFVKNL